MQFKFILFHLSSHEQIHQLRTLIGHLLLERMFHWLKFCNFTISVPKQTKCPTLFQTSPPIHGKADRKAHRFVRLLSANHSCNSHPVDQWEYSHIVATNLSAFLSSSHPITPKMHLTLDMIFPQKSQRIGDKV